MEKIIIAIVNRPHGVRGELKITAKTEFIKERFVVGNPLYLELDGKVEEYILKSIRKNNDAYLIQFEGITNMNEIEHLRHANILIDYDELHELPEGQHYFIDLVGLEVYVEDELLGVVKEMFDTPAHPIMKVKAAERDIMIPYVDRFIKDVDMEAKKIQVDWLEGL